jgi:hypothetical protein
MRQNWLGEMYSEIKQSRDARLSCILNLLSKKAINDADIAEALRLLSPWVSSQGQFEGDSSGQNQNGEDVSQRGKSLTNWEGKQDET